LFLVGIVTAAGTGFFGISKAAGPIRATDANPPNGTILSPLPGGWSGNPYLSLQARFTDPDGIAISSLYMSIDGMVLGTSWTNFFLSAYAQGLPEGLHTAEARASDQLGNGPTILSWSFSIDTTLPVVTITSPVRNPILPTGSVTLAWTGTDVASGIDHYEVRLDDGPPLEAGTATTFPFPGLAPGVHYFTVTAYDVAGNYAYETAIATVPAGPPGSAGNSTNQVTVVLPDQIPTWAVGLIAINAVEATALLALALRRRRQPPETASPP